MKNTEKLATQGIRDEEKHRTNEKYRETGNIGYTKRRRTNQTHNIISVGHHYIALLQTTGGKDEPN